MKYGYLRISARGCAKADHKKAAQESKLRQAGAQEIIVDRFEGKKASHPELDRVIEKLSPGDMLIATELNRLAYSIGEAGEIIANLTNRGIQVYIINLDGIFDAQTISEPVRNLLLSLGQLEHDILLERVLTGKTIAKKNSGFQEGRPKKYSKSEIDAAIELLENHSYAQVQKLTGISPSTLRRYKMKPKQKSRSPQQLELTELLI